jgi:hypothetical protein
MYLKHVHGDDVGLVTNVGDMHRMHLHVLDWIMHTRLSYRPKWHRACGTTNNTPPQIHWRPLLLLRSVVMESAMLWMQRHA